jgi:hypothetical protein
MMAAGLRATAKALEHPPEPKVGAPVLDPVDGAGAGNVTMAAGLRATAKAVEHPPEPKIGAPVLDPTANDSNGSRAARQSLQNPLNRAGLSSVYRTVCCMFLWPSHSCSARVSCPSLANLKPQACRSM